VCVRSEEWKELSKLAANPSPIGLCPKVGAGDWLLPK
jgi:hypothetical protein